MIEGAGGAGSRYAGDGRIWRAKPNIEPRGLDMGGACRRPLEKGGGGSHDVGDVLVEGAGGTGNRYAGDGRI